MDIRADDVPSSSESPRIGLAAFPLNREAIVHITRDCAPGFTTALLQSSPLHHWSAVVRLFHDMYPDPEEEDAQVTSHAILQAAEAKRRQYNFIAEGASLAVHHHDERVDDPDARIPPHVHSLQTLVYTALQPSFGLQQQPSAHALHHMFSVVSEHLPLGQASAFWNSYQKINRLRNSEVCSTWDQLVCNLRWVCGKRTRLYGTLGTLLCAGARIDAREEQVRILLDAPFEGESMS